jgi:hypothetical protein
LTYDLGPTLNTTITSSYYARLQGNATGDNARGHYDLLGPADTSGGYQAWVRAPLEQRNRFDDRRIGSATFNGLPTVTATGVPESTGCVPRTKAGACGALADALMHERGIELAATDPYRGWLDRRGFGQLVPGTILHMPIPARYLVSMGLPLYSFGGVGNDGAAK